MIGAYLTPRTGPGAAPLALGCMNFGKRTPRAEALRLVERAVDEGIGLLDTANAYNEGESERIVGEALRGKRDRVLVATKVGFGRVAGRAEGLSAERIADACDESLQRLGVDVIDLYYLHVPDHQTPIAESLQALARLLEVGKIRRWGISNYASWQILEMRNVAEASGMPGPAVAQQLYNALIRQLDLEYFAFARQFPIHTTVYNPLAGGLLAGTHDPDGAARKGSRFDGNALYRRRYWRRAMFDAIEAMREVADAEHVSLVTLAYAFVLRHPGVDSVLVGPGSEAHLQAALDARDAVVSAGAFDRLREIHHDLVGTDTSYAR